MNNKGKSSIIVFVLCIIILFLVSLLVLSFKPGFFSKNLVANSKNDSIVLYREEAVWITKAWKKFDNEVGICYKHVKTDNNRKYFDMVSTSILQNENSMVEYYPTEETDFCIHTHPSIMSSCLLSEVDKKTFSNSTNIYKGVVCGSNPEEDIVVYNRDFESVEVILE